MTMGHKVTEEDARKIIESYGCELVGRYNGYKENCKIKCVCGNIRDVLFSWFINSKTHLCRNCSKKAEDTKWNILTMQKWCDKNGKEDFSILQMKWVQQTYQKQKWVLIKCSNPDHEPHWMNWNGFKKVKGNECPVKWNEREVVDFYSSHGLQIIDMDDYKDIDTCIYCYDSDGFKVRASITNLKRDGSKPSPFQYNPFALENLKLYCKLFRPDYKILSKKYTGIKTLYEWEYLGDSFLDGADRKFNLTADGFVNGGCGHPQLTKSRSEIESERFFVENNINYIYQYSFSDCKDKNVLRYDFGIFDNFGNFLFVLELQGKQHREYIKWFGGEKGFKDIKRRDLIKFNYCKDNEIDLKYIYDTDFNRIPEILTEYLNL